MSYICYNFKRSYKVIISQGIKGETMEAILVYLAMAIAISYLAIKEDGFKFVVYDRDKDGVVQEGTKWQRRYFYWNRNPLK